MATLVSALDIMNNVQYGENNHKEYKWSNIQQEKILQLSFQLLRTENVNKRTEIAVRFRDSFEKGTLEEKKILIKLLAHTRDVEEGKGEYAISFSILKQLMQVNKELCTEIIKAFVGIEENTIESTTIGKKSLGSWKDMKYLFNELKYCPDELIKITNAQLKKDHINMSNMKPCSLLAKWIPRETSKKFGWIHEKLAKDYFTHYGRSGWTSSAIKKAQTHYRQLVSSINKHLGTVQINQCDHTWRNINFNRVTSITMMKQKNAFLNSKNIDSEDRQKCKENLLEYMQNVKKGLYEMKGKQTSMVDFVKSAIFNKDTNERDIINEMWKNNSKNTKSLEKMIAMVDTSGSMETDNAIPLYSAIGLGIRVAEKSKLGKRVMTFNSNPTWINIDENNCKDFVDQVQTIQQAGWGANTNFHKALDVILEQIVKNKLKAEDVEDLVLVVFSDMQFDSAMSRKHDNDDINNNTVRRILEDKFYEAGVAVCGKGYKVPHILFWNLRSTTGFPELSYQPNVTMMSGYNPNLLNSFVENGINGLHDITPWTMLVKMLDNPRYNHLEKYVE